MKIEKWDGDRSSGVGGYLAATELATMLDGFVLIRARYATFVQICKHRVCINTSIQVFLTFTDRLPMCGQIVEATRKCPPPPINGNFSPLLLTVGLAILLDSLTFQGALLEVDLFLSP